MINYQYQLKTIPSSEPSCSVSMARSLDKDRSDMQQFIFHNFYKAYQAQVDHFADLLIGCKSNEDHHWMAVFGMSNLADKKAYLEQYLHQPIESYIAFMTGQKVERSEIFELGNLAAEYPGATRRLIKKMASMIYNQGGRWVVFTANNLVLNAFHKLDLNPQVISIADPDLLPNHGINWGQYYETKPQVMFIKVPSHI
ncbi:MAG: thermostable hemolysin [Candidatus Methylopumilus sp.]